MKGNSEKEKAGGDEGWREKKKIAQAKGRRKMSREVPSRQRYLTKRRPRGAVKAIYNKSKREDRN